MHCVSGKRLGVFWIHVVFGCPTSCSFFFFFQVTAPISALDNFVAVLVGLSIEVAKERDFTQAEPMKFKDLGS